MSNQINIQKLKLVTFSKRLIAVSRSKQKAINIIVQAYSQSFPVVSIINYPVKENNLWTLVI